MKVSRVWFPKQSPRENQLISTSRFNKRFLCLFKMSGMEFTPIRDLKSGMKNLSIMFVVLDVGKYFVNISMSVMFC